MPTLEDRIDRLEAQIQTVRDRDELVELTARYCRAVANEDMDTLISLFTDDATLETTFPPGSGQDQSTTTGHPALREAYAGTAGMALRPCVHNHITELHGDRARGYCSVEIRLIQSGVAYTAAGHYEDQFRRVAGEWRFQRRNLVLYHWVPQTEGWA
jgi:ketosteroid isomerase-like protein